jgi:hypothetical protein
MSTSPVPPRSDGPPASGPSAPSPQGAVPSAVDAPTRSWKGMDLGNLVTVAGHRFISDALRLVSRPTLDRFARVASMQTTDLEEALRAVAGGDEEALRSWMGEYSPSNVGSAPNAPWTASWNVEVVHAKLLYVLVRRFRPATVLETGVRFGQSSRAILTALKRNGRGRLISTEISSDVGGLVEPELRDRWELKVIPTRASAFERVVRDIGPLEFFLHDSRHTYRWQRTEYRHAWPALAAGGVLVSDDVDASYAFLDACRRWGVRPVILVGRSKVMGLTTKPAPSGG